MSNNRPKLLSVKEVAEWFGVNPMTIYRKVKKGEIPAIKFGKNWLFPEDKLMEWLNAQLGNKETKAEKITTDLSNLSSKFAELLEIELIYFFGSASEGINTPLSDIDIAYLDDGSSPPFDLEAKLEEIILREIPNVPRIDLVRLKGSTVAIQYSAIRNGQLIYKRSDEARANFEEDVVNRYLDYSTVLDSFYKEVA